MAKRRLKQSQKAFKSRYYYQRSKLKKITEQYKQYSDRSKTNKSKFEGHLRSNKSVSDILLNRSKSINNKLSELELKIKNFKSNSKIKKILKKNFKKKQGSQNIPLCRVFEREDCDNFLKLKWIKKVNGLLKLKDYDKVQNLVDALFHEMDSKTVMYVTIFRGLGEVELNLVTGNGSDKETKSINETRENFKLIKKPKKRKKK